jgi:hypothetical protein
MLFNANTFSYENQNCSHQPALPIKINVFFLSWTRITQKHAPISRCSKPMCRCSNLLRCSKPMLAARNLCSLLETYVGCSKLLKTNHTTLLKTYVWLLTTNVSLLETYFRCSKCGLRFAFNNSATPILTYS